MAESDSQLKQIEQVIAWMHRVRLNCEIEAAKLALDFYRTKDTATQARLDQQIGRAAAYGSARTSLLADPMLPPEIVASMQAAGPVRPGQPSPPREGPSPDSAALIEPSTD